MGEKDQLRQEVIAYSSIISAHANDNLCAMLTQAHEINNNKTNLKITMGHFSGCRKQQSSMRKPGIPPARIPEITSRHDIHPDTLKQTPTMLGRNESGEKNYRSKTGEWNKI